MPYRFALESVDYSDFASGHVFVTAPGYPGFPVRLVSEIFQRCLALLRSEGLDRPCRVYDPCCGSAYLLSTLAYLHAQEIGEIIGSDVNDDALGLARRNLALLTKGGLEARIAELQELYQRYQKDSHAKALAAARRLCRHLEEIGSEPPLRIRLFRADATQKTELVTRIGNGPVDIVLTDVPHGQLSSWQTSAETAEGESAPLERLLEALQPILATQSIVAIATDKQQKGAHPAYQRCDRFQLGKRRVEFLRLLI